MLQQFYPENNRAKRNIAEALRVYTRIKDEQVFESNFPSFIIHFLNLDLKCKPLTCILIF